MQNFLGCCNNVDDQSTSADLPLGSIPGDVASTAHIMRQSVLDEIRSGKPRFVDGRVHSDGVNVSVASVTSDKVSVKDSAPIRVDASLNSEKEFLFQGVASAGLDSRTMRVLEARVYDLIKEVLDVDNMNVVRRNFVSLLRQSVRLFFSTTLKHWASAQAKVSYLGTRFDYARVLKVLIVFTL